jgi:hypothetical protein
MVRDLAHWLQSHRATMSVAGLVAFSGPTTFFAGAVSVMDSPDASSVATLGALLALYGALLWLLLLIAGYALYRIGPRNGGARAALALPLACLAVVAADSATAPHRGRINLEQGVVTSLRTMQLYSATFSLAMSLLFFAHLERGRAHEAAAGRLASAQNAQRRLRRRAAEIQLKALQARIDPQLLFDMLDAVRRCYETDVRRAERGLDELVAFLRAALPRLRTPSSTVARECELACAYVSLWRLLRGSADKVTVHVDSDATRARFPPGVLVPLLEDVQGCGAGVYELNAAQDGPDCRLVVRLPARPSAAGLARAQSMLVDLYAASASIICSPRADGGVEVTIRVPHEVA